MNAYKRTGQYASEMLVPPCLFVLVQYRTSSPLIDKWIKKMCHVYTLFSAIRKNKMMLFARENVYGIKVAEELSS